MQRKNHFAPDASGQELSPAEQFRQLLPLARMLIAEGVTPFPDFTLAEFDATAQLMNHASGAEPLDPQALREVIRTSRPNRAQRRRARSERRR